MDNTELLKTYAENNVGEQYYIPIVERSSRNTTTEFGEVCGYNIYNNRFILVGFNDDTGWPESDYSRSNYKFLKKYKTYWNVPFKL